MDAVRRMGEETYLITSEMTDNKRKSPYDKRKEIHNFFYNFSDYF